MKVLAVAVVALALAAPAGAAPRLTTADRAAITRTIDVFVNHAVKRVDTATAYDVVAPEMRPGISRGQWARGDIPVYPFPARGITHPWNVLYITRAEIGLELQLIPRAGAKVGPIIFHIYLRPARGGRWLVDSFMPVATLAPLGAKKSKVLSVRDFSPGAQGDGRSAAPGQISRIYLAAPFAVIALLLVGLGGWGVVRAIQGRRLQGPRGGTLPPLPPRRVSGRGT
ncbi:MAG TPA: hypothetical protein VNB46_05820 [Gaiellaceae bacterium]|jgi:hypothetical protein|nr:hypothetical protein [Gaiellaceae bacterium]